jgi:hypothetical protein
MSSQLLTSMRMPWPERRWTCNGTSWGIRLIYALVGFVADGRWCGPGGDGGVHLRRQIMLGELKEGDQLSSESVLMAAAVPRHAAVGCLEACAVLEPAALGDRATATVVELLS